MSGGVVLAGRRRQGEDPPEVWRVLGGEAGVGGRGFPRPPGHSAFSALAKGAASSLAARPLAVR